MQYPPQPPPPQVVVVKSGCGKLAIILACIAGVCALLVGGCFVVGIAGIGKGINHVAKEAKKHEDARKAVLANLEIVDYKWNKQATGNVMTATFKIRNKGTTDVKDIEILCEHTAASGTLIDSNRRTIYEVVKAGETREFKDFNMGFIHSQVESSTASITDAKTVTGATTKAPGP